ncbi:MAG: hypothetical protein U1E36_02135 [Rickettsiales bacterium]
MTSCTLKSCTVNYCFIAKLLVAIPAIPMLAAIAASFSDDPVWQITLVAYAGAVAVWLAQKIDQIPYLTQKFTPFKRK